MVLKCFGSSSRGNCYLLESKAGERLLIECGVHISKIKEALGFDYTGVVGCLVSHKHKDHSISIKEVAKLGISVLGNAETIGEVDDSCKVFCRELEAKKCYRLGGYKIIPLRLQHDVDCLGFVVEHEEMGVMLFVTDTMLFKYNVKGLNHILIECNYSDECLKESIERGDVPESMRDRLLHSHLELQTTINILRRMDLMECREIVLLHLSEHNSNEEEFKREVSGATGKEVYCAKRGLELNFDKEPY